jgi:hypothetical protein
MMVLAVMMFVVVAVTISTAFRLKGGLDLLKIRPQASEHIFDYVVWPDKKNAVSNLRWQMPIAEVPGKAHQLYRIFMFDLYKILRSCLNF